MILFALAQHVPVPHLMDSINNGILKIRKGKWNMSKYYSVEFKLEPVKRAQKSREPVAIISAELGVNENTFHGWIKRFREKPDTR